MASDYLTIELAGREVRVSSPDKVFFAKHSETKLDLIDFYVAIEEPLMRAMSDRPTLMQRFPDGASGKSFFQKRVPKGAPDWLATTTISTPNGTTSNAMVVTDIAHVAWAVNMGCLGFHLWPFHSQNPGFTDELRIDLDPSPGIDFDDIRAAALAVKELLDELGISSFPKTTGSRGLHVFAPLRPQWDSYDVRLAAVALARELGRRYPKTLTAAWWKEERGQRVFVDFNQNAPHKTVFGAWSVRSRVGAQVSTPFWWEELADIKPDVLTMDAVVARVEADGDPWAAKADPSAANGLEPLLAMHETDQANGLGDAPWPPVYPKMPHEPPRVAPSRAKAT
ncbi:MAG: DNA polymerase domain-containing protein [Actinomycetia bacterium]|nr:DNA polymerase domain-containing protein [Actinomycetes bacterium]